MRLLMRLASGLLGLSMVLTIPALAADISSSHWSETDSSNNHASPNGWTSGVMLPSQVEPTARSMMGATKRFYNHINGTVTSAGTANAQTLTYSVAPSALVAGDVFTFLVGTSLTNTGTTTLNVNSLGAIAVQNQGTALAGGELPAGKYVSVVYDGTNFQLLSMPSLAQAFPGSFGSTPTSTMYVNIGSYPIASEVAGGVLQAISGKVVVPNTYTQQPQPNSALAGYIENDNSAAGNSGVAVWGFAQTNQNGANPYGANFTAQNFPNPSGSGHDFLYMIGSEMDVAAANKSGAVQPSGTIYALNVQNFSSVNPTGGSYAVRVKMAGSIPFDNAFFTEDGAATNGFNIGAASSSNNVQSELGIFRARTSGGGNITAALVLNASSVFSVTQAVCSFCTSSQALDSGAAFLAHAGTNQNFEIRPHINLGSGIAITAPQDNLAANLPIEILAVTQISAALTVTGAPVFSGLPTSAGGGGLFVCVDTSGNFYKKSTCP